MNEIIEVNSAEFVTSGNISFLYNELSNQDPMNETISHLDNYVEIRV